MTTHATIALFYGSSTCYTEMAAEKIAKQFAPFDVDIFNVADTPLSEIEKYPFIVFGIPTWDFGELQEDWENCWDALTNIDFSGKKTAIFGLGDQEGYPEWFLDAMGYLHDVLINQNADVFGYWPNQGYHFESSQALTQDKQFFVGLALDDENEFDLSESRIQQWVSNLKDTMLVQ